MCSSVTIAALSRKRFPWLARAGSLLSCAATVSTIVLPGAVPAKVIEQIRARMAAGPFVSGKLSAVGRAAAIKNNLLLAPDSAAAAGAVELLAGALQTSVPFQVAAWPEAMMQ